MDANTKPRRILIETVHGLESARVVRMPIRRDGTRDPILSGYLPILFDGGSGPLLCRVDRIHEISVLAIAGAV